MLLNHLKIKFPALVLVVGLGVLCFVGSIEFFMVEPLLYHSAERKGEAMLDFFSKTVRNDLLSGYRGGLNVSAELLVSSGQCDSVKIYDASWHIVASFPSVEISANTPETSAIHGTEALRSKETVIQWKKAYLDLFRSVYFDDTFGNRVGTIQIGINQQHLRQTIFIFRSGLLGFALLFVALFIFVLNKVIQNKILDPLAGLAYRLKCIGEGDSDSILKRQKVNIFEINEILSLCQTFVDRVKTAEDMIERKGAATAIGELMQDFSHGIRTPITVIKNRALDIALESEKLIALKNISRDELDRLKQKLLLQKEAIIDESGKVEIFVSRILDSTQPIDVHSTPTALYHLVEKVIEIYRVQAFQKKIVFLNQIDPNLPILLLDRVYFEEVFDNLFSNAVFAIESHDQVEEGYVRVCSEATKSGSIKIIVEDNGCGIEERNLKMIFKPHFTTKKGRGNGRGLFIVQRILDKHHSYMTTQSQLGKGTTMTIHFGEGAIHVQ